MDKRSARSARSVESNLPITFKDNVLQFPSTEPRGEARAELLTTIYERIIPELVMAHRPDVAPELPDMCADVRPPPTEEEIATFAQIAVSQDLTKALAFIQDMAAAGLSLEVVLLQLVAPSARLLGADWEIDQRTFTEVTIGLGLLQKVIGVLGPSFAPGIPDRGFIVLVSPQSEQHTLGIYLLGEFLRRDGWSVQVAPSMSHSTLLSLVESEPVQVVGLSVSNTDLLEPLGRLVRSIKSASVNPDLTVMLGGTRALEEHASDLGATYCSDATEAVRWLERHARTAAR